MIAYLAGILLLPVWMVTASPDVPRPDLETGKRIYQERCQVCHGSQGDGKSFAANALNPPPRNFISAVSKKQLTQKRMIDSATNGRPKTAMMPWKDVLTAEEISAVVYFIRKELMGIEG